MFTEYIDPLVGGVIIGIAASVMLYSIGRISGISGIIGGLWSLSRNREWWRVFYVAGLVLGTALYILLIERPAFVLSAGYLNIIFGGLLVGYGTRLGSGCTSGHGVCGIARLSPRSIAATIIFMASAIVTVWIRRQLGGL